MKGRALLFSAFKAVEDLAIWAGAKAAADPARRERAVIFIMVWCRKVCFVCSMKMLCDVAKPGQKCIFLLFRPYKSIIQSRNLCFEVFNLACLWGGDFPSRKLPIRCRPPLPPPPPPPPTRKTTRQPHHHNSSTLLPPSLQSSSSWKIIIPK